MSVCTSSNRNNFLCSCFLDDEEKKPAQLLPYCTSTCTCYVRSTCNTVRTTQINDRIHPSKTSCLDVQNSSPLFVERRGSAVHPCSSSKRKNYSIFFWSGAQNKTCTRQNNKSTTERAMYYVKQD